MAKSNSLKIPFDVVDPSLPLNFNWVEKGAVSPVQDQMQCGGNWAFAVSSSLESLAFIKGLDI